MSQFLLVFLIKTQMRICKGLIMHSSDQYINFSLYEPFHKLFLFHIRPLDSAFFFLCLA